MAHSHDGSIRTDPAGAVQAGVHARDFLASRWRRWWLEATRCHRGIAECVPAAAAAVGPDLRSYEDRRPDISIRHAGAAETAYRHAVYRHAVICGAGSLRAARGRNGTTRHLCGHFLHLVAGHGLHRRSIRGGAKRRGHRREDQSSQGEQDQHAPTNAPQTHATFITSRLRCANFSQRNVLAASELSALFVACSGGADAADEDALGTAFPAAVRSLRGGRGRRSDGSAARQGFAAARERRRA